MSSYRLVRAKPSYPALNQWYVSIRTPTSRFDITHSRRSPAAIL